MMIPENRVLDEPLLWDICEETLHCRCTCRKSGKYCERIASLAIEAQKFGVSTEIINQKDMLSHRLNMDPLMSSYLRNNLIEFSVSDGKVLWRKYGELLWHK